MPRPKKDANHGEISKAFENLGATVQDTSMVGNGFPDIVVGYLGYNVPVEIKTDIGKLSKRQKEWKKNWKGSTVVVRTVGEVTRLLRLLDDIHYTNTHNLTTKLLETHMEISGG